jgi:hypothetical protein
MYVRAQVCCPPGDKCNLPNQPDEYVPATCSAQCAKIFNPFCKRRGWAAFASGIHVSTQNSTAAQMTSAVKI